MMFSGYLAMVVGHGKVIACFNGFHPFFGAFFRKSKHLSWLGKIIEGWVKPATLSKNHVQKLDKNEWKWFEMNKMIDNRGWKA